VDDFQSAIALVRATPISPHAEWKLVVKTPVEGIQQIGLSEDESQVIVHRASDICHFLSSTGEPAAAPSTVTVAPLTSTTSDGWSTEQLAIDWPQVTLLLREPGFVDYLNGRYFVVARPTDVVAWGFSPSGKHLVLATELGFGLWTRQESN
jgi:hypothetical protein